MSVGAFVDVEVMNQRSQSLITLVRSGLIDHGQEFEVVRTDRGVILRRDRDYATIQPTQARVLRGASKPVNGNFTKPGLHWRRFWETLDPKLSTPVKTARHPKPKVTRPPPPQTPEFTLVTNLKKRVSSESIEVAIRSSEQIRTERTIALAHTAKLIADDRTLTLEPISLRGNAPQVVFQYSIPDRKLRGAMYLRSPEIPIAIGVDPKSDRDLIGEAWICALAGFAALTCPEQDTHASTPGRPPTGGQTARTNKPPRNTPRPQARKPAIGNSRLTPDESTQQIAASYVPGHVRRLSPGRSPSAEARLRAESIGIQLGLHETWVQPHARGLPDDIDLTFRWELDDFLASVLEGISSK